MDHLRQRSNATSSRLIKRVLAEACTALLQHLRLYAHGQALSEQGSEDDEYGFPSLYVSPTVGEWQDVGGQLLSSKTPCAVKFQEVGKRREH